MNQDFFINNRKKLRSLFMGTAPIVFTANVVLQQNSDNTYPFRQDSSFWYFTGINLPGLVLVIDRESEYLIMPKRSAFSEVADGVVDDQTLAQISGIDNIYDQVLGWKKLTSRLKKVRHAAILPSLNVINEKLDFYPNPAREILINKIKLTNSDIKLLDISEHVIQMRVIKQDLEIKAITKAVEITTDTIKIIKKNLNKYNYEYEIEATVLSEFRKRNSLPAYSSIVAGGINACTLHYNRNDSLIKPKNLILIDIGASVDNYAADITRTILPSNDLSKRQRQVLGSVVEVQKFAASLLRPGVELRKYESEVEIFMGEQLRSLGLIASVTTENVRKYYPHSTSHFLGLDPHDCGNYSLPVEQNMVLTIEPGIYIPEEGIGVRIEDDFIIKNQGVHKISHNLPPILN
ncbi:MAG TPA: Xaa-Pro aminopeptidase [Candidatus Dormibacteraeota bacterium]|nr:Xaa-Pro aminopeptidase [Candidatus Dormibacteraeota bacterium]